MKAVDLEEEKQQREKEKEKQALAPKLNAKHHYDKDDLISFHQIFISKALVKACQDLDYEHPTVI